MEDSPLICIELHCRQVLGIYGYSFQLLAFLRIHCSSLCGSHLAVAASEAAPSTKAAVSTQDMQQHQQRQHHQQRQQHQHVACRLLYCVLCPSWFILVLSFAWLSYSSVDSQPCTDVCRQRTLKREIFSSLLCKHWCLSTSQCNVRALVATQDPV